MFFKLPHYNTTSLTRTYTIMAVDSGCGGFGEFRTALLKYLVSRK